MLAMRDWTLTPAPTGVPAAETTPKRTWGNSGTALTGEALRPSNRDSVSTSRNRAIKPAVILADTFHLAHGLHLVAMGYGGPRAFSAINFSPP